MSDFAVPIEYTWVLLVALLNAFLYQLHVIPVDKARNSIFTQAFIEENFGEEHRKAFPNTPVPKWGYPDCGSGRYSEKLTYKQWVEFNNAQRIHLNFFEQVTFLLTVLLIAGLAFPITAAVLGSVVFLGRILYAWGYSNKGANGRFQGLLFTALGQLALLVMATVSSLTIAEVF